MAKQLKVKDSSSQTEYFYIQDTGTSLGKTGLVYNTSGLAAAYIRNRGVVVDITLADLAAVNSAFSSGGFKEIDATKFPGVYRLDIPDAAFASGVDSVIVQLRGTNIFSPPAQWQITGCDMNNATSLGLGNLANAVATTESVVTAIFTQLLSHSDFNTASSFGKLVKDNLDAAITSRPTAAAIVTAILTQLLSHSDFNTASSFGKLVKDNLDAAITTRPTAAAITTAILTQLLSHADFNTTSSFGKLIKDNLDAAISSRMAATTIPTAAQICTQILTQLLSHNDFNTASSFGKLVKDNLDAAITSRPTASVVTTAILTQLLSHADFNTAASFGKLIKDMLADLDQMTESNGTSNVKFTATALYNSPSGGGGGGSDPLLNQVPGSYAPGTAGNVLGKLNGAGVIQVSAPVQTGGEIRLIRGDSYYNADGRALVFVADAASWPDLTGSAVVLNIKHSGGNLQVAGTITGAYALRVELSTVQTDTLPTGSWPYDLDCTLANGHKVTLATNIIVVSDDQS